MASIAVDVLLSGIRDTSGNPLAAGLVYTYAPGTTTPRALYVDSGLGTPAANPVVLDAYGMATCYADNTYKFIVKTSGGTTLYTWDNLNFQAPADDAFPNGGNAGGANRTMGNTDNYSLGFLTNNANRLHLTSDGKVGVNTTSPSMKLHVKDESATLAGSRLEATVNNIATALELYSNASNANYRNWRVSANETEGVLQFVSSASTSSAPSVLCGYIRPSGGGANFFGGISTNGLFRTDLPSSGTSLILASTVSNLQIVHETSGYVTLQNTGSDTASHGLLYKSTNNTIFFISNSGRVGINTSTPSGALGVNGEVEASSFCTNTSYSWTMAGYTATAPSPTGYVTITIEGTTYKLLAST